MEVNLHRTRSLLGEKVIHLRHLEQSLDRVASAKRNENEPSSTRNDELTLSDMSSASSGFSSTDLGTDTFIGELLSVHLSFPSLFHFLPSRLFIFRFACFFESLPKENVSFVRFLSLNDFSFDLASRSRRIQTNRITTRSRRKSSQAWKA